MVYLVSRPELIGADNKSPSDSGRNSPVEVGGGVTAIEWAEKAELLLPARTVHVRIRGAGDEPRTVEIEGAPPGWVSRD